MVNIAVKEIFCCRDSEFYFYSVDLDLFSEEEKSMVEMYGGMNGIVYHYGDNKLDFLMNNYARSPTEEDSDEYTNAPYYMVFVFCC